MIIFEKIKDFFKKIGLMGKAVISFIAGLIGLLLFFKINKKYVNNVDKKKTKENEKLKVENERIDARIEVNNENMNIIDKEISTKEDNIEDIKNTENKEGLDKFFDNRGF